MSEQRWDPEQYALNARFVSDLGEPVLELLDPQAGERVLDLGCGDGVLTEKLVAAGCAVVAVDESPEQVAAARERGLDARVARAEGLEFSCEFDAVFSNAVLHWVADQEGALGGVFRALRPGGRFVAELGGAGCVEKIRRALYEGLARRGLDGEALDPWFFPTQAQYTRLLEGQGFFVESVDLFSRPTLLPGDVAGWLETFAQPFLGPLALEERRDLIEEAREALRPELYAPGRGWMADYMRLRLLARRPDA